MIQVKLTTDTFTEDFVDYLEDIQDTSYQIAEETAEDIRPQFLADIQQPAPPVQYPIQWTSERQRRAFFATNGFGAGIPTRRTGALEDAWTFGITRGSDGQFIVLIQNNKDYSKFTGGSLAQDRTQALRFQQRFHRNTGHLPYTDVVTFWLDAWQETYERKMDARFAEFAKLKTKKRAFTSGRR